MTSLILVNPSSMASQPLSLSLSSCHSFSLSFSSLSLSSPTLSLPTVYCGRGDRKTAKGKRFNHSFGNARRPRNKNNGRGPPKAPSPPAGPKKDPFDSGEVVKIEITDE